MLEAKEQKCEFVHGRKHELGSSRETNFVLINCQVDQVILHGFGISRKISISFTNTPKRNKKSRGLKLLYQVNKIIQFPQFLTQSFMFRAGFIYIYELDSENLPFFTLALAEADIKVNIGDPPSILISKKAEDSETTSYKLLIFTRGSLEATRIERIITFSDSCKVKHIFKSSPAVTLNYSQCDSHSYFVVEF